MENTPNSNNFGYKLVINFLNTRWDIFIAILVTLSSFFLLCVSQIKSEYYNIPIKYFLDTKIVFSIKLYCAIFIIFIIVWPIIKSKILRNNDKVTIVEFTSSITLILFFLFVFITIVYKNKSLNISSYYINNLLIIILAYIFTIFIHLYDFYSVKNTPCKIKYSILILLFIVFIFCLYKYIKASKNYYMVYFSIIIFFVYIISICVYLLKDTFNRLNLSNINCEIVINFILDLFRKNKILVFVLLIYPIIFTPFIISKIEDIFTVYIKQYELIKFNNSENTMKAIITEYKDFLVVMDCEIKYEEKTNQTILYIYNDKFEVIEQNTTGSIIYDNHSSSLSTKVNDCEYIGYSDVVIQPHETIN